MKQSKLLTWILRASWLCILSGTVVGFLGCKIGLGSEVDLIPPELTITSPSNLEYVPQTFAIQGTWSDNQGIGEIVITNASTGAILGKASIQGSEWNALVSLPEGEQNIRVTAYDKNQNSGQKSTRTITVLVDATSPYVKKLELVRLSGSRDDPRPLDALKALDLLSKENLDLFHNEIVRIEATIAENFQMQNVTLHVLDESGQDVLVLSNKSQNKFSPYFELTQEMLTQKNSLYASGRHYFRLTMEAYDQAGNKNTDQFFWFCWYPEADQPKVVHMPAVTEGRIVVPSGNMVTFDFYDDDGLGVVQMKQLSITEWNNVQGTTDEEKLNYLKNNDSARQTLLGASLVGSEGGRIKTHSLSVGSISGEYRLVAMVRDVKNDGTSRLWNAQVWPLLVTDEDAPVLFVESPAQNTVPVVDENGTFTLQGYVLDNRGTTTMLMAWVPIGSSRTEESVKSELANCQLGVGGKITLQDGTVLRRIALTAAADRVINGVTYKQHTFQIPLNLFTDFLYNGNIQNTTKKLYFLVKDEDENKTYQSFVLAGDQAPPTITISYPSQDLQVHDVAQDLVIQFSASKESGLAIEQARLEDITNNANPQELTLSRTGNTWSSTVSAASLSEGRRTYRISVTDKLGNVATQQRTVILTALPALSYITSSQSNGLYKTGQPLLLQAKFSRPVRVTGGPRLRLRYTPTDTSDKYASYTSGNGTDTLVFTFTVPSGAESSQLRTPSTPIDLNGGTIEPTEGLGGSALLPGINGVPPLEEAKSLQGRKELAIDGVPPVISSLTVNPGYYRAGTTIIATLTLSERVLVNGSPQLLLSGTNPAQFTGSFLQVADNVLTFAFGISAGQTANPLSYNLSSCIPSNQLSSITDLAGNPLVLSTSGTGVTSAYVDTTAPAAPGISGVTNGAKYNSPVTITLTGLETGAQGSYSLNGGVSWQPYTNPVAVGASGAYTVMATQRDQAGNISPISNPVSFEMNTAFPDIQELSCENPDGTYGIGSVMRFKLVFANTVKTIGSGATVTIGSGASARTATVVQNPTGAAVLYFEYTVSAGDVFNPVTVSAINLTNVQDLYGNSPGTVTVPTFNRPGLKIDGVPPAVSSRSPEPNTASSDSQISVTFNEPIFVESGLIEVRRTGNWYIPVVLTEAEFAAIYYSSALTEADRQTLMFTENGAPLLHPQTGQPVGPYRKITHGLKLSGSTYVPDTATKYVLDFPFSAADNQEVTYALDLNNDGDTNDLGETRTIAAGAIRAVLEKTGYHRQTVDVASYAVSITGNTVTITLPKPLVRGRQWTVTIPAGAFRDGAGNTNEEIIWSFWSDQVATPVIRVDRYSHGWGAQEPIVSGGYITGYRSVGNVDITTVPTGYVRVRIDCETPGATILYGTLTKSSATVDPTGVGSNQTRSSSNADATDTDLSGINSATLYTGFFPLGDGALNTAIKYYIAATATKAANGSEPALTASDRGYEGVFKSIIMYREPGSTGPLRFEGSNIQGGMPTISGFPLRDADPDIRFSKYAYNTGADWYWISWEIVSIWYNQSVRANWQQGYYENSYGNYLYSYQKTYW
ncbi:Ig-like domain-containing protein [Treponema sp. J25]|uniref:Ig-like domain-containing protein n=1 Tax=Treponema sp. J25 TaxID=2094121 RepID=UPI00104D9F84|nr:Ig-like domain-containing protein [Treponema sp. J25]TCW61238.1 hypothetical protein C5O22_07610 [Treponema sp. J25]